MYERGIGKNPIPAVDRHFLENRKIMKIVAAHDGYAGMRKNRDSKEGTVEGTSSIVTDNTQEILKMKKADEKQYQIKGKDIISPKHENPVYNRR